MTDALVEKIRTLNFKFTQKDRLPLGEQEKSRYIPSKETGGLPVFIPSMGALEKEEVDYIALAAIENEKERVRKRRYSAQKERLEQVALLVKQAKPGQRAKTAKQAIKELEG